MKIVEKLTIGETDFFQSYLRPYRPTVITTVSRCIKEELKMAVIDINIFQVHSVRTTAALAAKFKEVLLKHLQNFPTNP